MGQRCDGLVLGSLRRLRAGCGGRAAGGPLHQHGAPIPGTPHRGHHEYLGHLQHFGKLERVAALAPIPGILASYELAPRRDAAPFAAGAPIRQGLGLPRSAARRRGRCEGVVVLVFLLFEAGGTLLGGGEGPLARCRFRAVAARGLGHGLGAGQARPIGVQLGQGYGLYGHLALYAGVPGDLHRAEAAGARRSHDLVPVEYELLFSHDSSCCVYRCVRSLVHRILPRNAAGRAASGPAGPTKMTQRPAPARPPALPGAHRRAREAVAPGRSAGTPAYPRPG